LVGLGRWRRRWALAALLGAASAGCDGDGGPEARRVGSGEALVEVLDEGSGFANEAPLWPLTLGATLTKTGTNAAAAQVTDAWPLPGGGQGFTLRWRLTAVNFPMDWHALAQTPDGLYVLASAAGGQLHRPLLVLPSTVRLGMRWRSWARPHDAARLDLGELGTLDRTGGYEFKVVRVVRENGAGSPLVTRRRWEIEWKGPRNPTGTGQGDYPREPARGTLVFLEGIGPIGDVAFPALGFGQYGLRLPDSSLSDGIRLLPAPAPAEAAAAPAVRLRPIPTPEALSSVWIRQLGVLDLDDGHGPWIRVDGNEAGLSYPSVFPGQAGGVGGNANLWVPSPTSHCFAFEGGRLVSGQELGVLAEGETCVAAAGAVVAEAGDAVFDTPFLDYFGRPLPQAEFGPRDARVSTQARGVLPGRGGAAPTLLARRNDGWHLLPWQAFEWSNRYDLDALAPVAAVDGAALDALDALGEPGQLLSQPVGDGAVGLLVRNTSRVGDATAWGYARLDPDGVIRDAVRYGEVGFEAAFRADAAGREVWQVDRAGRVWEWRLTATGLERRVRALLRLPGGQAP
ncbi:MAG: hypothetical protein KC613_19415, partial [Myxococcales bacterium]|nr:hypothetical protein [Myxococcales bacterium]